MICLEKSVLFEAFKSLIDFTLTLIEILQKAHRQSLSQCFRKARSLSPVVTSGRESLHNNSNATQGVYVNDSK